MPVSMLIQRKGRMFFKSLVRYSLKLDRKLETLNKLTPLIVMAFNVDKCEEIRKHSIGQGTVLQCFCGLLAKYKARCSVQSGFT